MGDGQVEGRVRVVAYGYLLGLVAGAAVFGYFLGGLGAAVGAAAAAALASVTIFAVMRRQRRL